MEDSFMIYFMAMVVVILLLVVAIVLYAFLHQKKLVLLRIRLSEEALLKQQDIFDALQEGQEQERARLSQEIHDGVAAKLSGLKMALEYLNLNAREHHELIAKIFTGVTESLDEVREISHNLQPYFFNNSIERLLADLVEQHNTTGKQHNTTGKCSFSLSMDPMESLQEEHLKLHIYRIISELLNNIRKHAQADQASVQINIESGAMTIVVEDNGIGMADDQHRLDSIGLKNIRNRVKVCKGNIDIESSDQGTTVIIELPLNNTE
ncbi:sensor histidine kinase [Taibaiella chishuiensis]|nr:ATP-binding protein [Taibaiella chishuiensis]